MSCQGKSIVGDHLAVDYALSRHVPDMERGFTIVTSYGDLIIQPDEAPAFVELVRETLRRRLDPDS